MYAPLRSGRDKSGFLRIKYKDRIAHISLMNPFSDKFEDLFSINCILDNGFMAFTSTAGMHSMDHTFINLIRLQDSSLPADKGREDELAR